MNIVGSSYPKTDELHSACEEAKAGNPRQDKDEPDRVPIEAESHRFGE
jgi:hypothetical protein